MHGISIRRSDSRKPRLLATGYNPAILPPLDHALARYFYFWLRPQLPKPSIPTHVPATAGFANQIPVPSSTTPVPEFEDIAQKAGLTVTHISSSDKKYIVESMSGGVGLIDCDNDGKLDIITVNGSTVERYRQGGDAMITLYHQNADST